MKRREKERKIFSKLISYVFQVFSNPFWSHAKPQSKPVRERHICLCAYYPPWACVWRDQRVSSVGGYLNPTRTKVRTLTPSSIKNQRIYNALSHGPFFSVAVNGFRKNFENFSVNFLRIDQGKGLAGFLTNDISQ
jgi:hypothetical protein